MPYPLTTAENIEEHVSRAAQQAGYVESLPIPLSQWTLDSGAALGTTASGNVYRAKVGPSSALAAIAWDATADNTDIIRLDWNAPDHFRGGGTVNTALHPTLVLEAATRLFHASSTDNTSLRLQCQVQIHSPGAASVETLASVLTADPPAAAPENSIDTFAWLKFNIGAALTDAQRKLLVRGAYVGIQLYPNGAIGTGTRLDVLKTRLWYSRHLVGQDKSYLYS